MVVTGDMNEFRAAVQTVVALGLCSSFFTFIRGTQRNYDSHTATTNHADPSVI